MISISVSMNGTRSIL